MNMEIFETVAYCALAVALALCLISWCVYVFVWDKTRIGKMEDENRQLKKMIVQKELENDLLRMRVDELVDMVYGNTEAPGDE